MKPITKIIMEAMHISSISSGPGGGGGGGGGIGMGGGGMGAGGGGLGFSFGFSLGFSSFLGFSSLGFSGGCCMRITVGCC